MAMISIPPQNPAAEKFIFYSFLAYFCPLHCRLRALQKVVRFLQNIFCPIQTGVRAIQMVFRQLQIVIRTVQMGVRPLQKSFRWAQKRVRALQNCFRVNELVF